LGLRRYVRLTVASVMEAAVNLSADTAVFGQFETTEQASGADARRSVRIRASLVDVRRVRKLGEFDLSGHLDDLSALQTRLCWEILRAIGAAGLPDEQQYLQAHPPVRLDALESYVRGLLASTPDQRMKLLANAARLEPGFSQPCFQLGRLYFTRREYRVAAEWLAKVKQGDLRSREASFLLGVSRHQTGDFRGAMEAFEFVSRTVPTAEVLNNLGAAQLRAGLPGATDTLRKAIETDPAEPEPHFNLGYALWREGDYAAAAESFRAVLQRNTDDATATLLLGYCLRQQQPRPGDPRTDGQERLRMEYRESAFLALKSMLGAQTKPQ
jgi:tetratricopeptide (TPR) repeat protein